MPEELFLGRPERPGNVGKPQGIEEGGAEDRRLMTRPQLTQQMLE
jgi:hypothetical protein